MSADGAPIDAPESHPLAEYDGNLETHADHVQAYAEILADADPDDVHGLMLVYYTDDGCDTLPSVHEDIDSRFASLWMLGSFIHHIAQTAQQSGGTATMEDVAADAIEYVRRHGIGGEI